MMLLRSVPFAFLYLALASTLGAEWKAGLAKRVITPEGPVWMSGYASRDRVADGTETDLWARAVLLEDGAGHRILAISLDLVGIDRATSLKIRDRLAEELRVPREGIALFCSHTHCGPVVGTNLLSMYSFGDEERARIRAYTENLIEKVVGVGHDAVRDLSPAELQYGTGTATFAVNRRANPEASVPELRSKDELKGPVDHSVPVLKIRSGNKLRGIVVGYACHATTLSYFKWCGDYPGFAMQELEASHPGAVAAFWAGCGADQNPLPRRTVELAQGYGHQLATAVEEVLTADLPPLEGPLAVVSAEIPLKFAHIPGREELEEAAKSSNSYEVQRARALLAELNRSGRVADSYPYPIQTWKIGNGPVCVTLGGEVVVDYSLSIKSLMPDQKVWVSGYANDVMAYIPSLRVLREGGYEGGGAMTYYGLPSPWDEDVEGRILKEVKRQLQAVGAGKSE